MVGRLIRNGATLAAVVLLSTAAGCALTGGPLPSGVVYPSITPDTAVSGTRAVVHTFRFEGRDHAVAIDVDESLYVGATQATKSVIRFGGARADDWLEDYYPAFVWEENQEAFFSALIEAMRGIRSAQGLDSDRYAELLTVFAQSLEYRTDPVDLEPKFPVETFTERAGDCDDKTLLLAGLLAREGYDVAIMLFEDEQHVALGLGTTGPDYRDTGYAFVETTGAGFIGMVPETLDGGITLTSAPQVFSVDGGSVRYGAGEQVTAILAGIEESKQAADSLGAQIERVDGDLAALETRMTAEKNRLDSLRANGRVDEFNAALAGYNALVEEFNARVAERNQLAEEYNQWVELQRFISESLHDRPAAYRRVTAAVR